MIKRAINAALLRRDPYLHMVLAPDGVADGAIVVAVVYGILMAPLVVDGVSVISAARLLLSGMFSWIILSGLVYLVGRHLLEGYGSFPSVMAATSIGTPVLLTSLALAPFLDPFTSRLVVSVWLVLTLWMAARVALDLTNEKAAMAAVGGWIAFIVVSSIFRF
ncbi:MAG: YIP1 family protein [Acidimicrobiia bacterium]